MTDPQPQPPPSPASRSLPDPDRRLWESPCNLLIVSDVHLGEYVKEHARIDYLKRTTELDRDFCEFLEYYADNRQDALPWRLVLNGDFLDLLTMTITPSESLQKRMPHLQLDEEEKRYGLDNEEEKAAWKIGRIAERHPILFTYLADFVGRGNWLDIVYGNHDIELFWPLAQQALVNQLVEIYFGTEAVAGQTEEEYTSRIRFHPWFIYQPGRFFIDHGNQYDDFTSFNHRLHPVMPFDPRGLAMPISHFAIRYFVNRFRGFRTHDKDTWTMWDFIKWMGQQNRQNYWFVIKSYFQLTRRILSYTLRTRQADHREIHQVHRQRLHQLAQQLDLEEDRLNTMDEMRRLPIHYTLGGTLQATAIDRWGLILLSMLLFLVAVLVPGSLFTIIGLVLLFLLVVFRKPALRFLRNRCLGGEVLPGAAVKLEEAAHSLARLWKVRYVIFGHSHRPLCQPVPGLTSSWYLNEGCWLVPELKERHEGGCRSPLTYCLLLDREVPHAKLLRWCQRNHRPEPFLAHLQAEVEPPEVIIRRDPDQGSQNGAKPGGEGKGPAAGSDSGAPALLNKSLRKQRSSPSR
ncbi:MAG: hypothetical protein JW797_16305 [Bradymonadales bacterium]|nr:hypothetical protein [Bradymonadales bacterium]